MGTPGSTLKAPPAPTKVIYWTAPIFDSHGDTNISEMLKFLTQKVPNNYFRENTTNEWNPGEEFEVHFADAEKRSTLVFICVLEIEGDEKNHSITCKLCKPKDAVQSHINTRKEKIAALISGDTSSHPE